MGTTPHGELPPDLVLTVEEASAFLKLDVQTVRALARSGDLPAVKLGKQWRFLRHRLIEALEPRGAHRVPVGDPQSPTVTQRDAAELLGVSVRTVNRMASDGRLEMLSSTTGVKRLSRSSVLRYLGAPPSGTDGGVGEKWTTTTTTE